MAIAQQQQHETVTATATTTTQSNFHKLFSIEELIFPIEQLNMRCHYWGVGVGWCSKLDDVHFAICETYFV